MKICIIGFPRSRSSILLETISLFYKIPIIGEHINELSKDKTITPSNPKYKMLLKNCLRAPDGVVRLHPLQLLENPYSNIQSDFELFNFEQYDKIYFTYRESVPDIVSSEFVARTFKKYTYKSSTEVEQNIKPMRFLKRHHTIIQEHTYSEQLVIKLKEHLKSKGIDSENLFYNNIPVYLKEHFPDTQTFHIETNYDYKSIIKNYDDILPLYNHYKNTV